MDFLNKQLQEKSWLHDPKDIEKQYTKIDYDFCQASGTSFLQAFFHCMQGFTGLFLNVKLVG